MHGATSSNAVASTVSVRPAISTCHFRSLRDAGATSSNAVASTVSVAGGFACHFRSLREATRHFVHRSRLNCLRNAGVSPATSAASVIQGAASSTASVMPAISTATSAASAMQGAASSAASTSIASTGPAIESTATIAAAATGAATHPPSVPAASGISATAGSINASSQVASSATGAGISSTPAAFSQESPATGAAAMTVSSTSSARARVVNSHSELSRRRIPVPGILRQGFQNQSIQNRRDVAIDAARRRRRLIDMRHHQLELAARFKRRPPAQHLVQHHAQRVQIAALVELAFALHLLRRDIARVADHGARIRIEGRVHRPGKRKIRELAESPRPQTECSPE